MEKETLKDNLLNQLNSFGKKIDEETKSHGYRFIDKLEKYGVIKDNLKMYVMNDGNLTFIWRFEKPKSASFNIDFNKIADNLNWCCYIEGMKDALYGSVEHLDDIVPYLKKFLGVS